MSKQHESRQAYWLLVVLILAWGFSWPAMKIGLQYIPPLWFCVLRIGIGALTMLLLLLLTGKLRLPTVKDLPIVFSVAFFQIALYLCFINVGLQHVNVGQSAILTFTTPIWITPLAVYVFKEPMSPLKAIGLLLAFCGIVVLFNPLHHDWSDNQVLIGNLELIGAAMCAGIAILHIRFASWNSSPLTLIPWQLLLATLFTSIFALCLEPHPVIHWTGQLALSLAYTGFIASAFGYWCVVTISKALPAITSSLALLGVPLLGLFLATVFLHEPFTFSLGVSMLLFIIGLVLVNIADAVMLRRNS